MADPQHLAMIQGVITRMASNSFLIKGWTVTVVAGLSAFATDKSDASFALIAVVVVVVFALLDAYYLALEKAYRDLFTTHAAQEGATEWAMEADAVRVGDIMAALSRPAVWLLHGVALVAAIVVAATA